MLKYILILLCNFLYTMCFSQNIAQVIKIKDGDTIVVLDESKNQTTIRLAEVDCPESGQAFSQNAKQFTAEQVFNKNITYHIVNIDRYGRVVAKVYYDNDKYLSEEIIKNGYGWWYHKYSDNKKLGQLQQEAKQKKIGLFQDIYALEPWEYRLFKYNSK